MADGTLLNCLRKTKEVGVRWKFLGLLLHVAKDRMDTIEAENLKYISACMMEMLDVWLKSNPKNPEKELDDALKELQHNCLIKAANNHQPDYVKLDHNIETQISCLKSEFADIVLQARRCLSACYFDAKEGAVWLNEILKGIEDEPLVIEGIFQDYDHLFQELQKKWGFTNSTLLQQLAEKTQNDCLKEKMKAYKERFDHFRSSFPISDRTVQREVLFEDLDPSKPCLILKVENVTTFDDIDIFLRNVFHIYKRYLRVHKIERGCIKVTLQFSASMEPFLQACIDQKREAVKHYADMCIEYVKEETCTMIQDTDEFPCKRPCRPAFYATSKNSPTEIHINA